ncbi:MAG: hypothetical protein H6538_06415 [Bacteroidales bacterium]|nr:hypothetical protein [Bacteroidales bacterium]MCB9012854.1 hypothetical protein [Bacteroidales bacterium]
MEVIHEFGSKTEDRVRNGYPVKIEMYISKAWDIFRQRIDYFVLFTLLLAIAISVPIVDVLLMQTLAAGFFIVAFKLSKGETIIFDHFFEGFKHFAGLLLFSLFSGIIIIIGFIVLILPGVYFLVGYIFTPFYIVFGKMDFWEAMESSRKLVHREWFGIFAFLIVLILLNIAGILAFGIGLLVTIPLSYLAVYVAFDDIIGVSN